MLQDSIILHFQDRNLYLFFLHLCSYLFFLVMCCRILNIVSCAVKQDLVVYPFYIPGGLESKESTCQCRRPGLVPWAGKIPWRKGWLPTPVFLPGEFCGQRRLVGYSPWNRKELDTTEGLTLYLLSSSQGLGGIS